MVARFNAVIDNYSSTEVVLKVNAKIVNNSEERNKYMYINVGSSDEMEQIRKDMDEVLLESYGDNIKKANELRLQGLKMLSESMDILKQCKNDFNEQIINEHPEIVL